MILGGKPMIILSCNNVTKYFGIDLILENITFSIQKGEKVGLVGVNGAGKSTLFKILCKVLPYDEGDLYIAKSTTLGYLEQSNILSEANSVYEEALLTFSHLIELEEGLRKMEQEIAEYSHHTEKQPELEALMEQYATLTESYEKNNGYGFRSEVKGVLRGLGFQEEDFSQPITQLSGGEKTRLSLAKLLLSKPTILLLDEPTNHLDIEAVEWLESFLKDYSGTVLMISHDRYFLDQVVTRILEIENRNIASFNGNFTTYIEKKKVLQEQQLKNYQNQQKEIERQEDIIRRLRQHGTEKLMNRAKSREKQFDKIEKLEQPQLYQKRAKIRFEAEIKSGNDILLLNEVSKSFGDEELFKNVSFPIYRGDKVALVGPNGVGKSTLLKMILGLSEVTAGEITLGHNVFPGYYDQEQRNLNGSKMVIDEIWDDHRLKNETEIRTLLGSFLFQEEEVYKLVSSLSGGEKARLSLLKLILSKANFLLLDEPTNHLDILSKEVLEEALVDYEGTLLVISHDRYFLNRVATKIVALDSTGTELFLGNYDYYQFKKREQLFQREEPIIEEKTKTQMKDERRKEREEKSRQREIAKKRQQLEADIMAIEEELSELEGMMCLEEVYASPEKSREVQQKTAFLREKLDEMYETWETTIDISS